MLYHGDCLDILKQGPSNSADALITDPPAGISFMGKDWDGNKGGRDEWVSWLTCVMAECLRVLKPGAHALVWAIPRTSHWTMTALEDAGFEIRDVVTHLFGTGFPKSLDVSKAIDREAGAEREVVGKRIVSNDIRGGNLKKGSATPLEMDITAPATAAARQWEGFGTALKPACEFWVLCRKPLSEKTVAKNVLKHGTGALNIDASRIGTTDCLNGGAYAKDKAKANEVYGKLDYNCGEYVQPTGRFPSHLILDEEAAAVLDEQSGGCRSSGKYKGRKTEFPPGYGGNVGKIAGPQYDDSGGASRFFYCAKSSKADRGDGNTHPTVKSTKLMSYLVRLITPPGGLVLDPFAGSGSTGVAAIAEGMRFVGIEQDESYYNIANDRLKKSG